MVVLAGIDVILIQSEIWRDRVFVGWEDSWAEEGVSVRTGCGTLLRSFRIRALWNPKISAHFLTSSHIQISNLLRVPLKHLLCHLLAYLLLKKLI